MDLYAPSHVSISFSIKPDRSRAVRSILTYFLLDDLEWSKTAAETALEEGRVTVAIVVSGRKVEGEGEARKDEEGKRGPVQESRVGREGMETKRAGDGCDGDGQWLYTG